MTTAENWQISTPDAQPTLALAIARRALIWAMLGLVIPVVIPSLIAWQEQGRSQAVSKSAGHIPETDLCKMVRALAIIGVLLEIIYMTGLVWATSL